ncbi:MAG TPA: SRPBCC domain-containing protein [Solirubrobacteraceae bacterium]
MTELVQRELKLDIAAEEAWEALTDPGRLSAWLADEVELDPVPGGEARFVLGDQVRSGWVEEICAPDDAPDGSGRLSFWWSCDDAPATRVELELQPLGDGGTLLRIAETRPLELLDLVGVPLPGSSRSGHGPVLMAA